MTSEATRSVASEPSGAPVRSSDGLGRWDMVDGEAREWWLIAREEIEGSEWSFPAGKWLVGFKDLRDGDWCVYPQGQYDGRIFGVPESLLKIVRPVKRPNDPSSATATKAVVERKGDNGKS